MSIISIENLSFAYEGSYNTVFENVDLNLNSCWKLGLVGRNGKGKTTLLKLINKELFPNQGKINTDLKTYRFPFMIKNEHIPVIDVIKDAIGDFNQLEYKMEILADKHDVKSSIKYSELMDEYYEKGGYEVDALIQKELNKMCLDLDILHQKFSTLSGGEKTKIAIIILFLRDNSFLLIDEPTNHLDILGRVTVANYLNEKTGFILVSHDEEFMNSCVDHVLSINKNSISLNKGSFSNWKNDRNNSENNELTKKRELLKECEKLETSASIARGWSYSKEKSKTQGIDSGFAGKRSAKMMKRAKVMEARKEKRLNEVKDLLKEYEECRPLVIKQERLMNKKYLEVFNLSYYINDTCLFKGINFQIRQGDRLWIKGGNGTGKTTLLNIISDEIKESSGYLYKNLDVSISYAHQDISNTDLTVNEYMKLSKSDKSIFATYLDYFNMSIDYLEKKISILSEGEKKKIEVAKTLSDTSELYLWDEILNYMDIHFRIQLENAILKYNPTLIFVSHDESFGRKIATKVIDLS